ncbi:MAG TPA: hypothetical protein VEH09_02630 [Thermodesulfobacteriota bacterium]|nr:hypothetical protein [Thermodesulfobacteriota bacterium]
MVDKLTYSECELRYIDQGYDIERAVATCAEAESRSSDKESGKSNQDESWDEYWGET